MRLGARGFEIFSVRCMTEKVCAPRSASQECHSKLNLEYIQNAQMPTFQGLSLKTYEALGLRVRVALAAYSYYSEQHPKCFTYIGFDGTLTDRQ